MCDPGISAVNFFSHFIPLDKEHVPKNLWKLSVTYLFKDTDFPFEGL